METIREASTNISVSVYSDKVDLKVVAEELLKVAGTANSVHADEEFVLRATSALKAFCLKHNASLAFNETLQAALAFREGRILDIFVNITSEKRGKITIVPYCGVNEVAIVSSKGIDSEADAIDRKHEALTAELNAMIFETT